MEAILKFILPEEQDQFMITSKAMNLANVIRELDNYLRNKNKYEGITELKIEELRTEIKRFCKENNVLHEVFDL